ncbi:MAG TPA: hypothetical protein VFI53_13750 [Myxococcaceae bacterium]|nr:hypothetical protein [Myxococcaceae bacterium]
MTRRQALTVTSASGIVLRMDGEQRRCLRTLLFTLGFFAVVGIFAQLFA